MTMTNIQTISQHPNLEGIQHRAVVLREQAAEYDQKAIDHAVMTGDLRKLTERQRLDFYRAACLSVGLNPLTQPFTVMERQDKSLWLYANSTCSQQLAKIHQISFVDLKRVHEELFGDPLYRVELTATTGDGRSLPAQGVVSLTKKKKTQSGKWPSGDPKFVDALDEDGEPIYIPLRGEALANAIMKCDTKAQRRATLALVGLGWMATEAEGRHVGLNMQTGEVIDVEATPVDTQPLAERPSEQDKGLAEHIGDLYGDRETLPERSPHLAAIDSAHREAGQDARFLSAYWAKMCKRFQVATREAFPDATLQRLLAEVHAYYAKQEAQPPSPEPEPSSTEAPLAPWRGLLADVLGNAHDANLVREATAVLEDPDAADATGEALLARVLNLVDAQDAGMPF